MNAAPPVTNTRMVSRGQHAITGDRPEASKPSSLGLLQSRNSMVWSLGAVPGRLARRVRRKLEHALLGHVGLESIAIGRSHAGGVIDGIELNDDGTLSVVGWSPDAVAYAEPMHLSAGGQSIPATHVFRVTRPDLARLGGVHTERLGIIVEFVVPPRWSGLTATLAVGGTPIAAVRLPAFSQPAYGELYGNPGVWHREDVYGVGQPVSHVSTEVLDLCADLPGPLLDFGCGAGALVAALRAGGIDASGLELDQAQMREAARPDARAHLTYYSGVFPAPFADGAFRAVTCCEVLEHIPDYEQAVAELARLTRERVVVTVPDMSGVPRGFRHGVVPWHLLERSHLNFFTQQSLGALLRRHFSRVDFFRIGEIRCGRMRFYTSLAARCVK